MNRENAAAFLPLVQALADGKTIQYHHFVKGWIDSNNPSFDGARPEWYRIKPEPREWRGEVIARRYDGGGKLAEFTMRIRGSKSDLPRFGEILSLREILDEETP